MRTARVRPGRDRLGGLVEVDASYVGGKSPANGARNRRQGACCGSRRRPVRSGKGTDPDGGGAGRLRQKLDRLRQSIGCGRPWCANRRLEWIQRTVCGRIRSHRRTPRCQRGRSTESTRSLGGLPSQALALRNPPRRCKSCTPSVLSRPVCVSFQPTNIKNLAKWIPK